MKEKEEEMEEKNKGRARESGRETEEDRWGKWNERERQ